MRNPSLWYSANTFERRLARLNDESSPTRD
jgi:hypothetical protein